MNNQPQSTPTAAKMCPPCHACADGADDADPFWASLECVQPEHLLECDAAAARAPQPGGGAQPRIRAARDSDLLRLLALEFQQPLNCCNATALAFSVSSLGVPTTVDRLFKCVGSDLDALMSLNMCTSG
jgi:hypothetical protein